VDEPGLAIVPYRPEHEAAVLQLWRDCGLTRPQNNPVRDIARKVADSRELFLVGLEDGRVVATVMAGYEGHRGWVNYLGVAPDRRRRGYGRLMMDAVTGRLVEIGCPKINLQVREGNEAALRFYEAIGYRRDAVIPMGKRLENDEFP
jgi:ribosomal protein S18 acetylase RimI-like enzyme